MPASPSTIGRILLSSSAQPRSPFSDAAQPTTEDDNDRFSRQAFIHESVGSGWRPRPFRWVAAMAFSFDCMSKHCQKGQRHRRHRASERARRTAGDLSLGRFPRQSQSALSLSLSLCCPLNSICRVKNDFLFKRPLSEAPRVAAQAEGTPSPQIRRDVRGAH